MECRETCGQLGNMFKHNLLFWKLDDRRREDGISGQTWFQEKFFISMGKMRVFIAVEEREGIVGG